MRSVSAVLVFALSACVAFGADASRSTKLKTPGGKNDKAGAAGMRPYTPEHVAVYNRGVTALDVRDYPQARKFFEAALALNDEFPEAHNNLAYTLRMQSLDNAEASLQHYKRALELAPKFAQALCYRGILFVQIGRAADAEKDRAALEAIGTAEAKKFAAELAKVIKAGKANKSQDVLSAYGALAQ